jgi:CheY-like chemotaxis protein
MKDGAEGKALILYVEDDDLIAHLVQQEITDYEILRVSDGDHAIEFLNRSVAYRDSPRPALVLLDLNMPKRDGFQILAEIRAIPSFAAIPVAMFTASQNPADREKAFALGATHFIQKPTGLDDFSRLDATLANIVRSTIEGSPE